MILIIREGEEMNRHVEICKLSASEGGRIIQMVGRCPWFMGSHASGRHLTKRRFGSNDIVNAGLSARHFLCVFQTTLTLDARCHLTH